MKKLSCLLMCIVFLQGCLASSFSNSYVAEVSNSSVYELIAKDITEQFSHEYPSGYTEISLELLKENLFSMALENELRKKGYVLNSTAPIKLSYTLDMLENSEYYIFLRFENNSLARLYDANGTALSEWIKQVGE